VTYHFDGRSHKYLKTFRCVHTGSAENASPFNERGRTLCRKETFMVAPVDVCKAGWLALLSDDMYIFRKPSFYHSTSLLLPQLAIRPPLPPEHNKKKKRDAAALNLAFFWLSL